MIEQARISDNAIKIKKLGQLTKEESKAVDISKAKYEEFRLLRDKKKTSRFRKAFFILLSQFSNTQILK